jgi:hypothetical protein
VVSKTRSYSTLTKDNLCKRKWKGSAKCCFCDSLETIHHLFFDCKLARLCWKIIQICFSLRPPTSVADLFGTRLSGFHRKLFFLKIREFPALINKKGRKYRRQRRQVHTHHRDRPGHRNSPATKKEKQRNYS